MTTPTIVVGVDGSDNSQTALDWSISEALRRKAGLTLVHVVAPSSQAPTLGFPPEPPDDQRRLLDRAVQHAEGRGIQVTGHLLFGNPAGLLLDESKQADLLVVGSRGLGVLRRAALGSVSTHCVHHAHCPVVVVPCSPRSNQRTALSSL